jgi:succinylarginine dihydrolase
VGNQNVFLFHEQAYLNTSAFKEEVARKFMGEKLHFLEVSTEQVPIQDAVSTYLFNTQIVTLNDNAMSIVAPTHCLDNPKVYGYL